MFLQVLENNLSRNCFNYEILLLMFGLTWLGIHNKGLNIFEHGLRIGYKYITLFQKFRSENIMVFYQMFCITYYVIFLNKKKT